MLFETKYHYYLSNDTKYNGAFVDHVLRDFIANYNILINALYKNKHYSRLLQSMADEFNLSIVRINVAAGHGKEVIYAMSSFAMSCFAENSEKGYCHTRCVF